MPQELLRLAFENGADLFGNPGVEIDSFGAAVLLLFGLEAEIPVPRRPLVDCCGRIPAGGRAGPPACS